MSGRTARTSTSRGWIARVRVQLRRRAAAPADLRCDAWVRLEYQAAVHADDRKRAVGRQGEAALRVRDVVAVRVRPPGPPPLALVRPTRRPRRARPRSQSRHAPGPGPPHCPLPARAARARRSRPRGTGSHVRLGWGNAWAGTNWGAGVVRTVRPDRNHVNQSGKRAQLQRRQRSGPGGMPAGPAASKRSRPGGAAC